MAGQPKLPFYIAVFLVIAGLVGFAAWRAYGPDDQGGGPVADGGDGGDLTPPVMNEAEAPSADGITSVSEYKFVAAQKLPPVVGESKYSLGDNNTVTFALNVWAGWAPVVLANGGHQPQKVWKTPDGKEFRLELRLMDDPVKMQEAFAAGQVQIGWGTLDMLPLFMERLVDDSGKPLVSSAMPRVMQQVDWSNGGDGIVVRGDIKEVSDLRGKKVVLAQNSPSHYFLLSMLVNAGVQPAEVEYKFTATAFEAAAAFNQDKSLDACVSWAPDIYSVSEIQGNKLLVTSATANRLIADVWFARADFARDNPGICEAIVRGVFDAMQEMEDPQKKNEAARLLSSFFNIDAVEISAMFGDFYATNWGDNFQFMVNRNYLANFERVWNNAYRVYRKVGSTSKPRVAFDQVMDNTFIKKLAEVEPYKSQVNASKPFLPTEISDEEVESTAFLTTTHYIHFFPNSADVFRKQVREVNGEQREQLYDPNVNFILDRIGEQIGQFETSRIAIEGHTDASKKGQVDEQLVKELSRRRAESVRDALVNKFEQLEASRFTVVGRGWDKPVESGNHAKNRRVEVRILPAEAQ